MDQLVIQLAMPGIFRLDEWKFDSSPLLPAPIQLPFDSANHQLFHGATARGSSRFQTAVQRIGNINRGTHKCILAYLWFAASTGQAFDRRGRKDRGRER